VTGTLKWQLGDQLPKQPGGRVAAALAFAPDGRLLASWDSVARELCVWSLPSAKRILRLPVETGFTSNGRAARISLALSPDGRMLAVGLTGGDARVQLWELATAKLRREFSGHQG